MPSLSSSTNLTISLVNKATPVFTQLFYDNVEISEEAVPHSVVTTSVKAWSPQSDQVYYTIESGDEFNLFDIDFKKGIVICSCDEKKKIFRAYTNFFISAGRSVITLRTLRLILNLHRKTLYLFTYNISTFINAQGQSQLKRLLITSSRQSTFCK